jgi:hypothetical protein
MCSLRSATRSKNSYASRLVFCGGCIFLLFSVFARAEVIDRIVAVVDSHIISLSDLRQERDVRARLGEKAVDDDAALVKEMIDNYLIERQSADFPGVDAAPEEITSELQNSVAREGVASPAVRDAVGLRIRMRKYFDLRFRQFIRPSDDDVRKYYNDVFVPAAKAKQLSPIPPLTEVADAVRNNVIQEQLSHEVDVWLEAIRGRSTIEIFQ